MKKPSLRGNYEEKKEKNWDTRSNYWIKKVEILIFYLKISTSYRLKKRLNKSCFLFLYFLTGENGLLYIMYIIIYVVLWHWIWGYK